MGTLHEQQATRAPLRVLPALLLGATIAGCAVVPSEPHAIDPAAILHDELFPAHAQFTPESRNEVFELDAAARAYLDERVNSIRDIDDRGDALVEEIFHHAALSLTYRSGANTTASETFHLRRANCLSMSILTYAMARHVGYDAHFQEVDTPEYWERRASYSLMNRHVNVRLTPGTRIGASLFRRDIVVDFIMLPRNHRFPTRRIDTARVLAMFYNNKGVDALMARELDKAYAYFRAAVMEDPTLDMTVSNLGLLYAMEDRMDWAEQSYRAAHRMAPSNTVSAENLALILRSTGRLEEANALFAKVRQARHNNPYYQYIRGEEALDDGDLEQAMRLFRKALDIKRDVDLPWFGLARVYARLGDRERAEACLRKAERYAGHDAMKRRYREAMARFSDL